MLTEISNVPVPEHFRKRRSFVRRDGRRTAGQVRAHEQLWEQFGLEKVNGFLDWQQVFGRIAPTFLEIGFGSGQSLLAASEKFSDCNFIGIETHKPGIGALLLGVELKALTNLRVFYDDAVEVLQKAIPDASLSGVQIFFPDPWQKRRHHERRLIQAEFMQIILAKLQQSGSLHLATDWEDYAKHMMRVVSQSTGFKNTAGEHQYGSRSSLRPLVTKFERRAEREGRPIWEIQLQKL